MPIILNLEFSWASSTILFSVHTQGNCSVYKSHYAVCVLEWNMHTHSVEDFVPTYYFHKLIYSPDDFVRLMILLNLSCTFRLIVSWVKSEPLLCIICCLLSESFSSLATNKVGVIMGAVIGALLLLLLLLLLIWLLICCCNKRRYEKEIANEIRYDIAALYFF